jgi:polysaccharide export outer membrane protein
MKYGARILLVAVMVLMAGKASAADGQPGDYTIGDGDVLSVSVWKNPGLTDQVTVLPDGKISFPLVGEIVASGRSVAELKQELEAKVSHYVPSPVLTVEVQSVNSLLIYVIGKVNHPGRFLLNTQVDVLQALAMAGGLNLFAKRNEIQVFRKTTKGTQTFDFGYDSVVKGEDLSQNISLERGDVVVVP